MALDAELLKILACPACKSRVFEAADALYCTKADCRRKYAVTDGIPVMLIDESQVLEPDAWSQAMAQDPGAEKA